MGNCLVIQDRKEIKVTSMDLEGDILKAPPAPLKVQDALVVSPPGHGLISSDSGALPEQQQQQQHLDPAADMGRLHSLFPALKAPPAAVADPGVVRVKLVISKQQLRKMLGKDQTASLDDMVALMRRESEEEQESCRGWCPALHSIPEGSDLFC